MVEVRHAWEELARTPADADGLAEVRAAGAVRRQRRRMRRTVVASALAAVVVVVMVTRPAPPAEVVSGGGIGPATSDPPIPGPAPSRPSRSTKAVASPPFVPPTGYPLRSTERFGTGSAVVLTYTFEAPSPVVAGAVGPSIRVSVLDARELDGVDDPAAFARAVTGRDDLVAAEIDGRHVAVPLHDEVLDGSPFGVADRRTSLVVFRSGWLAVEVLATDPLTPVDVAALVDSFDDEAAATSYAEAMHDAGAADAGVAGGGG